MTSTEDVKLCFGGKDGNDLWTTDIHKSVPIFMPPGAEGVAALEPETLPSMFLNTVEKYGDRNAVNWRVPQDHTKGDLPSFYNDLVSVCEGSKWDSMTWSELSEQTYKFGAACLGAGLENKSAVVVMGFNTPHWLLAFYGVVQAGGVVAGSYPTNTQETVTYLTNDCKGKLALVENWGHGAKFEECLRSSDSSLTKIINWGKDMDKVPEDLKSSGQVVTFADFMATATDELVEKVKSIEKTLKPEECCDLIYTSGTTGPPKGVMLSHDNLTWDIKAGHAQIEKESGVKLGPEQVFLSYLPLSHIAAQVLDFMSAVCSGGSIYFATPDALKGAIVPLLQSCRPTFFFGVPRVWEKIMDKMKAKAAGNSNLKKKIALAAKATGLDRNMNLAASGGKSSGQWGIAYFLYNKLVFGKVKALLGLDRCTLFGSGAAPISKEVLNFFWALDIPIIEGFGMSETTGIATISSFATNVKLGTVGTEISPGLVKLDYEKNQGQEGNGEICMRGRNIMMGYLNKPEKTADTFDSERYLRSGDLGKFETSPDGRNQLLAITGRIKELIITAGGENIPPVLIEDQIKANCPMVSNAVLIGDRRKFLSMLITLRVEVNPDTLEPSNKLDANGLMAMKAVGSSATTCEEAAKDQKVLDAIQAGIDKYNAVAASRAQKVQKFTILSGDFSVPGGELTGTQKLKRPIVNKKYAEQIEAFYA